jgi:TRAP-type C4-dicarboxylate transport system permease small subunit
MYRILDMVLIILFLVAFGLIITGGWLQTYQKNTSNFQAYYTAGGVLMGVVALVGFIQVGSSKG